MLDLALTPERRARLLVAAVRQPKAVMQPRALKMKETLLHAIADAHVKSIAVAFRYAFAVARRKRGEDAIVAALKDALEDVLPLSLLKALVAGGEAGLTLLNKQVKSIKVVSRAAEFDPDQPRDESGRWTGTGSGIHSEPLVSKDAAQEQLEEIAGGKKFIQVNQENQIFSHLSSKERESYLIDYKHMPEARRDTVVEKTMRIGDLYATQKDIEVKEVSDFIRNTELARGSDEGELPLIVSWRGKLVVGDGHHRFAAAKLLGIEQMLVEYVDLTKYLKKHTELKVSEELRTAKGPEKPSASFKMKFDASNKDAAFWARKHAIELIDDVVGTTRERVRAAIARQQETGEDSYDAILAAVGDEERAQRIAHHESMLAASEGQRQGWDQAVDAGLLTGDEERTWLVVGDKKVCPICEGLADKRAKLGDVYVGDDGEEYDGPPAHVTCRCTEGIA